MNNTTAAATDRLAGNIGGTEGHRTATHHADGMCTCECGYRGTRQGLTSHLNLAGLGIAVGPTGALLNNAAGPRIAPVVDLATVQLRVENAGLRQVCEDHEREIAALRRQLAAAQGRATSAESKLGAVRRELTDTQLRLQSATIDAERMLPVVDAVFVWRMASDRAARAGAEADLVDASDNFHAIDANRVDADDEYAPATDEEAAEHAASFRAPLSPEDFFGGWEREDAQLDFAGANPSRPS